MRARRPSGIRRPPGSGGGCRGHRGAAPLLAGGAHGRVQVLDVGKPPQDRPVRKLRVEAQALEPGEDGVEDHTVLPALLVVAEQRRGKGGVAARRGAPRRRTRESLRDQAAPLDPKEPLRAGPDETLPRPFATENAKQSENRWRRPFRTRRGWRVSPAARSLARASTIFSRAPLPMSRRALPTLRT